MAFVFIDINTPPASLVVKNYDAGEMLVAVNEIKIELKVLTRTEGT